MLDVVPDMSRKLLQMERDYGLTPGECEAAMHVATMLYRSKYHDDECMDWWAKKSGVLIEKAWGSVKENPLYRRRAADA